MLIVIAGIIIYCGLATFLIKRTLFVPDVGSPILNSEYLNPG